MLDRVCICLVMDLSLVLSADTLKAIWTLKLSWDGCKQPEILAIEWSLAQETENVGAGAGTWAFSSWDGGGGLFLSLVYYLQYAKQESED